ncbi:UNVERIFIED_CONTAM: hypothetical protein HDU68_006600 [Siphonaria sp. JEL0065]|nr:hypothetical protein HDU68_006600 [Siphonaria sp. JEL0065]
MIEMASVAALSTPFLEGLLANYDGKIELDQTAAFGDSEVPAIDLVAREVYARHIVSNGGEFALDSISKWPSKRSSWEAVIRYLGTLFPVNVQQPQAAVVKLILEYTQNAESIQFQKPDHMSIIRNLVDMRILQREQLQDGSTVFWRTNNEGHPMALGKGVIPRF